MPRPRPSSPRSPSLVHRRLPGGARVLCLPALDPGAPVAIQLWVAAGTAAERAREHGCAHLLEHLLFKPFAEGGPEGDLALRIEALGGDVNAFTSHDETVLYATVPAPAWGEAVDAILWAGLRPALDREEVTREIEVVVEEIKQYDDEPGQRAAQSLLSAIHGEHAYGRPVLGLTREVRAHSAQVLRGFHRRVYAGERLSLVVVGPVDPKAVVARARPILGKMPEARPIAAGKAPPPAKRRVQVRRDDIREAHLFLGWRGPPLEHPQLAAIDVAAVVLGHGDASRLVREIRRGAHLVTDVHASLDVGREGSTAMIVARTGPAQVAAASAAILDQVRRLATAPIGGEELARARAVLESDLVYRRETVQGQAHVIGYYASLTGDPGREEAYYSALAALTPETVQAAVAAWLPADAAAITATLPEEMVDAAGARACRSAIAATGRATGRKRKLHAEEGVLAVDLECGLRVRILPDHGVPICAGWLAWLGGQGSEPAAQAGLASLTAATLTRGNQRLGGDDLSRAIEGVAASLSGFAGRSSMGLHGEAIARHFPEVLDHMIECALTPTFPEDEVAEERRVALEELAAADDDLGSVALRGLRELLYGEHPGARPLRGTPKGVRGLHSRALQGAWRRGYPIGEAVLAIVGDVDVDALVAALSARLADLDAPAARRARRIARPKALTRPRRRTLHREREQAHLAIGYPGLVLDDPRTPAMEVLCTVLGGQSGRLFLALREEEGLVYHVDAHSSESVGGGHFAVYAATSQDKLDRALAAIDRHLDRIVDEAVDAASLARAKAWLCGQHQIGLQRRSRIANEVAFDVARGLSPTRYRGYVERIEAVDAAAVLGLAQAIIVPKRRALSLVTSPKRR